MPNVPLPPYALAPTAFPFRHLVGLAGRAPIGGAREVALACFVAARLVADRRQEDEPAARAARIAGAKAWLGALALPAPVKTSVARCADVTAEGAGEAISKELVALSAAAASYLDAGSRGELESLAASLRA